MPGCPPVQNRGLHPGVVQLFVHSKSLSAADAAWPLPLPPELSNPEASTTLRLILAASAVHEKWLSLSRLPGNLPLGWLLLAKAHYGCRASASRNPSPPAWMDTHGHGRPPGAQPQDDPVPLCPRLTPFRRGFEFASTFPPCSRTCAADPMAPGDPTGSVRRYVCVCAMW
jgi:hypothetical protein